MGDVNPMYVATIAFSYSQVFAISAMVKDRLYNDTVDVVVARLKFAVRRSIVVCTTIMIVVGPAGSFAIGDAVQSIAIDNFTMTSPITQLISFLLAVSLTLSCVIISFPAVEAMKRLAMAFLPERASENSRSWLVPLYATMIIGVDAFLPTEIAFALCGSLGLSCAAYIFPSALLFTIRVNSNPRLLVPAAIVAFLGSLLLFIATPFSILTLLEGSASNATRPKTLL